MFLISGKSVWLNYKFFLYKIPKLPTFILQTWYCTMGFSEASCIIKLHWTKSQWPIFFTHDSQILFSKLENGPFSMVFDLPVGPLGCVASKLEQKKLFLCHFFVLFEQTKKWTLFQAFGKVWGEWCSGCRLHKPHLSLYRTWADLLQ